MIKKQKYDPDLGCKRGEKNCYFCGERGIANMQNDKPDAPLQFLRLKGEETAAWICTNCREEQRGEA